MEKIDSDILMKLVGGIIFELDTKTNKVIKAYKDGEKICDTVSLYELAKVLSDLTDLNIKTFPLDEIASWILSFKKPLSGTVFTINKNDGTKCRRRITKIEGKEPHTIFCLVEDLDVKKDLYDLVDPLTGAYQKGAFNSILKKILNEKEIKPFYLLIIDIDNFKNINDTYGHLFGDTVLNATSNILKQHFKDGYVGRIGGDEFAVINFSSLTYQDIWDDLHELSKIVNSYSLSNEKGANVSLTIGCSRYGVDGDNFSTLFTKADRALYRGKRKGKNCFIIYDDEKHGNISVDVMERYANSFERTDSSSNKLLVSCFEILSRGIGYDKNIEQVLSLIGSYFLVERVSLYIYDEKNKTATLNKAWFDELKPSADVKFIPTEYGEADIKLWDSHNNDNTCKMASVANIETNDPPLYKFLSNQNVLSLLRYNLTFNDKLLGFLRLDMCSEDRAWQLDEIELFKVISRLVSIYVYKMNENKLMEEKLYLDRLTGLYNYQYFFEMGESILSNSTGKMAVYYFNIEHFRYINDVFGYKIGDKILIAIANILKEIYNQKNTYITRIQGDRFIVLEPYVSLEKINYNFSKFVDKVDNIHYDDSNLSHRIILGCGIYITKESENTLSSIVDKANLTRKSLNEATYTRYSLYNDGIKKKYQFEHQLEDHINTALNDHEFVIYLQPKVNIRTGEIVGAEALSRWNYKKERLLQPFEFIPLLERTGMITELDLYVFKEVCKFMKNLRDDGKQLFPISVNLSKCQNKLEMYVDEIEKIRMEYDISSSLIEIEITESLFINNVKLMSHVMERLHDLGYLISMDDFGSGYSNLSLLSQLSFDTLKIDKSLCDDSQNLKKKIIISSIVAMANNLDIPLLCEGIETHAQAKDLEELGFAFAQGYLYDKPLCISDFLEKYVK